MTTEAIPADPAVAAITAALAERERLEELRAQLLGRRPELEAVHAAAAAEADRMEAEVLLAADDRAAAKAADAARKRADAAGLELRRNDAALRALPALLEAVDRTIGTAGAAFQEMHEERRAAALRAYEHDVAVAAGQLAAVLKRGYALKAAAVPLRDHLDETRVSALRFGETHFIRGPVAMVEGAVVRLDEAWLQDEAAMSIFADLQPLRRIADQLASHRDRIARELAEQRIEENRRGRERAFTPGFHPPAERRDPATETWTPPAGIGRQHGYEVRTPGTPVPPSEGATRSAA